MTTDARAWLPDLADADRGEPVVVCFPPAGLAAHSFKSWTKQRAGVRFAPVHLPGRQARLSEPPLTRVEDVAETVATILESRATGSVSLYGHSLGGAIAYETALRLQDRGVIPHTLIIAACGGPDYWPITSTPSDALPDSAFLAAYIDHYGLSGGEDRDLFMLLMEAMLPALRADMGMCRRYVPVPRSLGFPVHVIVGEQDDDVPASSADGWKVVADAAYALHAVAGSHLFFQEHQEETIQLVLDIIR